MGEGSDAVAKPSIAVAGCEQSLGQGIVHRSGQVVAHMALGAARALPEQGDQALGAVEPGGFELGQRDPRRLSALGGVEFHCDVFGARDGALQQPLVDVADLFHAQSAVGERTPLELLDGLEQKQHGAVVDRQWLGGICAPVGTLGSALEEGEAIRVEQRAPQRRQAQVLVLDTAIHGTEDRQQARPGIPAAFQNLIGFGAQLHAQGRERIVGLVAFVAQQQQAALLGGEQEDQPHHHRQCGFVEFRLFYVTQQLTVAVLVGFVERLDQHFDGAANLLTEGVGDLVLILQRAVEQSRQLLGFIDEEAPNAQQVHEGLQGDGLLTPEARIPAGEGGDSAHRGIHQHPALAVGHEPQAAAGGTAELDHALGRCCGPAVQLQGGVEIDVLPVGVDEHQWRVAVTDDGKVRRQTDAVLGQSDVQVRGAPVLALEHVAATVLIEFQPARQDFVDPCRVQIGEARIVRFQRFAPFVVGLAQPLALGCIEFFQSLREGFLQDGDGEERTGNLDERKPVVVLIVLAHA
jgi:hypothetical protein